MQMRLADFLPTRRVVVEAARCSSKPQNLISLLYRGGLIATAKASPITRNDRYWKLNPSAGMPEPGHVPQDARLPMQHYSQVEHDAEMVGRTGGGPFHDDFDDADSPVKKETHTRKKLIRTAIKTGQAGERRREKTDQTTDRIPVTLTKMAKPQNSIHASDTMLSTFTRIRV